MHLGGGADLDQSIKTFFAAWGMSDTNARTSTIGNVTSDTTIYADPRTNAPLTGSAAISEYVSLFAQAAPGATASVVKSDIIQDTARVTVAFRMADGMTQYGQYFVEAHDDTITRMTGFVGTGAPE